MAMLDLPAEEDDGAYKGQRVTPADPDHMPPVQRLMHVLADRSAWQTALATARRKADELSADASATRRAAA
jgi:hypothetical protein